MNAEPAVPPPPIPPEEPKFPGRDRIMVVGAGIGLVAIAVALLTLPADTIPVPTTSAVVDTNIHPPLAQVATSPVTAAPPPALPPPPAAETNPVKPVTGEIAAVALARGSVVKLDGKMTARRHFTVSPGRHVLEVAQPGFITRTDTLSVAAGQTMSWTPTMVALPAGKAAATEPLPKHAANPDDAACKQLMASASWRDAFSVCVRAAQAGSSSAQHSVAVLYQRGDGVRRNDDSATRWFAPAARSGDAEAMYQLGIAYERGRGIGKDQGVALDWYTRAANAGNADAQFVVGEAFEKGRLGAAKDRSKALEWYKRAAAQGHKDAATRVKDLQK